MTIFKALIYVMLLFLCVFSFYMFWLNKQNLENYDLAKTKIVSGNFESFNKEETKKATYFNFKLKGTTSVFEIPSPEWKSFDFESFNSIVKIGDYITLTIPNSEVSNSGTINVFQLRARGRDFINFEIMKQERQLEMYLAFLIGFISIIGIIHHTYRPWHF